MKILVLNSRIYAIEFELLEMPAEKPLAKGVMEKIGMETSILKYFPENKKEMRIVEPAIDHTRAIEIIIQTLVSPAYGVISKKEQIEGIGHRVVHGGENCKESVIVNDSVKREIYKCIELAPLHNPFNLKGIEASEKILPKIPKVAVFDTSFYRHMAEHVYLYALPYNVYKDYGIRKYGFHGISHMYSTQVVSNELKIPLAKLKLISCHLGLGCSITAVKNGVAVDTTMGFSPLDGIMMSTRSGSIDPFVVIYLMKVGWTVNDIQTCLNRQSGLLGVSGISDDMERVLIRMKEGDKKAKLAVNMFVYQIQKAIGAFFAVLEGVDAISFTGGIGVNSPYIREIIIEKFKKYGAILDKTLNKKPAGEVLVISDKKSEVNIISVKRNEHLMKARETYRVITRCGVP